MGICRREKAAVETYQKTAQQMHLPDGKKRGGADPVSFGGPLVMQVVPRISLKLALTRHLKPARLADQPRRYVINKEH